MIRLDRAARGNPHENAAAHYADAAAFFKPPAPGPTLPSATRTLALDLGEKIALASLPLPKKSREVEIVRNKGAVCDRLLVVAETPVAVGTIEIHQRIERGIKLHGAGEIGDGRLVSTHPVKNIRAVVITALRRLGTGIDLLAAEIARIIETLLLTQTENRVRINAT